jgi:glutamate 5-kinase
VRGSITINNQAGRALRKKCVAVLAEHVLDCSGNFRVGDQVYVTFRGKDGGQYVIATGVVGCDVEVLRQIMGRWADACTTPSENQDSTVVIREQDLKLLWQSKGDID